MKIRLTEDMKIQDKWYKETNSMTLDRLPEFINKLLDDYSHDYGTICHAITAGGLATMHAMDNHEQGGITGFQAGCIMWEFIRRYMYHDNKTGLKLINYDNFLYPQYEDRFQKRISPETWIAIRKEAAAKIRIFGDTCNKQVYSHWLSIVNGIVPFGFVVEG